MYSRKDKIPNYIEFSKDQTRIERFFWYIKSCHGNLIWTLQASFQEKWIGTTRKTQHVYLGEKEGERISAMRNTMIQGAENLKLEPIYDFKSDKESTMDQVLVICNRAYDIATLKHEEGVCHNQKV